MWLFIQMQQSPNIDPSDWDRQVAVFKSQKGVRDYLKDNDWSPRQISRVMDGEVWYDGEASYTVRYCPLGELVNF